MVSDKATALDSCETHLSLVQQLDWNADCRRHLGDPTRPVGPPSRDAAHAEHTLVEPAVSCRRVAAGKVRAVAALRRRFAFGQSIFPVREAASKRSPRYGS